MYLHEDEPNVIEFVPAFTLCYVSYSPAKYCYLPMLIFNRLLFDEIIFYCSSRESLIKAALMNGCGMRRGSRTRYHERERERRGEGGRNEVEPVAAR